MGVITHYQMVRLLNVIMKGTSLAALNMVIVEELIGIAKLQALTTEKVKTKGWAKRYGYQNPLI